MKLIVGLGNIGSHYTHTRHNFGFMVADAIAADLQASWKLDKRLHAEVAIAQLPANEGVLLAKPQTMMNLSGEAVQRLMQAHKIAPSDLWVLFDDVDVPFGRLRLRHGGSGGGHQGANSIIRSIGSDFMRARLGISLNDRAVEPSESYVLKQFTPSEQKQLPEIIDRAADLILDQIQAPLTEDTTFTLA